MGAGLRREEAANLRFEDVKLVPRGDRFRTVLAIEGKGAKNWTVLISDALANAIDRWAGVVGKTPDRGPVLGAAEEVEGLFLDIGWGGYGFMGAPVGGELLSALIVNGSPPDVMRPFNPQRFDRGELVVEPTIIGAED